MQLTALAQTVLIDRLLHLKQRAARLSVMANIAANAAWRARQEGGPGAAAAERGQGLDLATSS